MRLSKKNRKFLAVWCCDGLETLYDLTELEREQADWEKEATWRILKEEKHCDKPTGPRLQTILLRARVNSQRQYEVYIFTTSGLTRDDVLHTFEESPQFMADFIRKNGSKIFSDYHPDRNRVIE
jgi:hypothetical protein